MSQQKWKFWGWEHPGKFFEVQKVVEGAPVGRRFCFFPRTCSGAGASDPQVCARGAAA